MANEIFIDTSGFLSLLTSDDDRHAAAVKIIGAARKKKRRFITTDYVLDETVTLLKASRKTHLIASLFERIDQSQAIRIEWTDSERFQIVRQFFLKHADKAWSFTDSLSFVVMSDLRLRDALTKDEHFHQAGYSALLR